MKRDPLGLHLAVNAIQMFVSPADLAWNAYFLHLLFHDSTDLLHEFFARRSFFIDLPGDHLIDVGLQMLKRQIFQFDFNLLNAEPIRNGRVDIHRLLGDLDAFVFHEMG